jgi:hypothetical protein
VIGNVISGNNGWAGIAICGSGSICGGGDAGTQGNNASANVVQSNFIGTNVSGGLLGNSGYGVSIDGAVNTLVGGATTSERNVIMASGGAGVAVFNPGATGNRIIGNSINSSGGLGIDLGNGGVTPNDTGDADTGPNELQNFPVLTAATPSSVTVTLNSRPGQPFSIQLFTNGTTCPTSGHGEGGTLVSTFDVTTDADTGNVEVTPEVSLTEGEFVAATATDKAGNTSEFSACRLVEIPDGGGGQ